MQIQVVKSKIHRVKVTGADLNYIGSITIDEDLMDAAQIIEGEKVQIVNNNNGERLETYVIPDRQSGEITLNGAAARRVAPGDIIIIMSYGFTTIEEGKAFKPSLVFPMIIIYLHHEAANKKTLKSHYSISDRCFFCCNFYC